MTLFFLAYFAGVLTILAPCVLPVLPFVFARVDRPFVRSGLPLLAGMALSFTGIATLATLSGAWVAEANDIGRGIAIVLLAAMGLALLFPRLADIGSRPLIALGARLAQIAQRNTATTGHSVLPSLLLGVATGLLWTPCAGPVLGLVLTTAALQGASVKTSLLLLTYAAGAATSLALALWVSGRMFIAMKRFLCVGDWLRRAAGVAVLASVAAVALDLDTELLARFIPSGGSSLEQNLLDIWAPRSTPIGQSRESLHASYLPNFITAAAADTLASTPPSGQAPSLTLPMEGMLPDIAGATAWLNSPPLSREALRGKVVLIDFWTFACINCQHALPYVRAWSEKYRDQGLVVIGVHAPEFAFERNIDNVKHAVEKLGLQFPIAIDNDFAIWRSFANRYWPASYLIDAQGRIRFHHFGEGEYEDSEQAIRQLLEEARQSTREKISAATSRSPLGNRDQSSS